MCHALFKCKNEKKSVKIIDLELCSSLKWDSVYRKGTSWAGPIQMKFTLKLFMSKNELKSVTSFG